MALLQRSSNSPASPPRRVSRLNGQTTTPGSAGNISVRANEIRLTNGAEITSYTQGPGDAGIITLIVPGTLTIENGSGISTTT